MIDVIKCKKPIVGISIDTQQVTCSALTHYSKNQFTIRAFSSINFDIPVKKNIYLFGITRLKDEIKTFLYTHRLNTSYVILSVTPPGILERVINLKIETPQEHHLQQERSQPLIWDYQTLGHNKKTGKTHYYLCGISREHLFAYQLLALLSGINCVGIIPQRVALLNAAQYLYPENPELDSIMNHASLQNYVYYMREKIPIASIFTNYKQCYTKNALIESLGLFFAGNYIYERY